MAEHPHTAPRTATCKCCGGEARLFDVVDFHKNCEQRTGNDPLPLSGIPVYYHRCGTCGFIFTVAFDYFSDADMAELIYNDDYELVDPDFLSRRPLHNARAMAQRFRDDRDIRILDFGGGNGRLADEMRAAGFASIETWDPFSPGFAERPQGRFDAVLCFEVMEHSTDPLATLSDIDSLLSPGGMCVFSTCLQPHDIEDVRLGWWYAAPRNGHVSLYTTESLTRLARNFGFTFGSLDQGTHLLFRTVPTFATHFIEVAA